jgi:hypothetical protein
MPAESVVEVRGVVGDLVGQVDQLGLEGRPESRKVGVQFGGFSRPEVAGMFDDALADFEREIQPGESGVALFELLDDP